MFCRANRGKDLSSEKIFADFFFFFATVPVALIQKKYN